LIFIDDRTKQRLLTGPVSGLDEKRQTSGLALAIVAAAVSLVLLITVGAPVQLLNTAFGVWFTEVFAFLGSGWIILRWTGYDPLQFVGARRPDREQAGLGFAIGAANFFGIVVPLQYLQQPLIPQELKEQFDASRLFANQRPLELILIVAGITIAAPFCEEFVFRGIIQKGLAARFSQRTAILATALLFSAFHLDPVGFVSRVELGILFGVLYQRSASIWPGAMAHAANNLVSASLFLISQKIAPSKETEPSWQYVAGLSGIGLCVMAWLIIVASRRRGTEFANAAQSNSDPAISAQSQAIGTEESKGQTTEDATQVAARPSPRRLLIPWLAAAGVSLLLLVALDRRGVVLNLYDLAYHLPPLEKDAPIAEQQARDQLQALRAKARRGEVPIAKYLAQRRALRSQGYESGPSRKTRPAPTREPMP
jgi:membrane protease YdiL (CAAX protease family)